MQVKEVLKFFQARVVFLTVEENYKKNCGICSRFIFNSPHEDHQSSDRLLFLCERAWWYYCDFMCSESSKLPKIELTEFVQISMFLLDPTQNQLLFLKTRNNNKYKKLIQKLVFQHYTFFSVYSLDVPSLIRQWHKYKNQVTVCGCIILNDNLTKVSKYLPCKNK